MTPLKLSDIRTEIPLRISRSVGCDWSDFLRWHRDGIIDFDVYLPSIGMNLQRDLVWTLHQKQQFIMSVLLERPIPKVCIIGYFPDETKGITHVEVIDGKQRINAYISFFYGDFPLPTGHYFSDLAGDAKKAFFNFHTTKDDHTAFFGETVPDSAKIAWFEQINFTGTPQDEEHLKRLKSTNQ